MRKNSSIRSNNIGDHYMSFKPIPDKKCTVYVHHFNNDPKISHKLSDCSEIHRNTYKHEYSDYYNAKYKSLKDQFDNLSIRSSQISKPKTIPNVNSTPISKFNKIIFQSPKAAVDKLEETYWSKWKPKPHNETRRAASKPASSNAKIRVSDKQVESNFDCREDEEIFNEFIYKPPSVTITNVCQEVQVPDTTDMEFRTDEAEFRIEAKSATDASEVGMETEVANEAEMETNGFPTSNPSDVQLLSLVEERSEETESSTVTVPLKIISSESSVTIKHTDSFILTSRKQSEEKQRYQQPRCIKLFKNAGYVSCTTTNYIKGGSYPLKSCLKKNNCNNKSTCLGRPGSPLKISMHSKTHKTRKVSQ